MNIKEKNSMGRINLKENIVKVISIIKYLVLSLFTQNVSQKIIRNSIEVTNTLFSLPHIQPIKPWSHCNTSIKTQILTRHS